MLANRRPRMVLAAAVGLAAAIGTAAWAVSASAGTPAPSGTTRASHGGMISAPAVQPAAPASPGPAAASAIAYPIGCCLYGNPIGVTVTGQATVRGGGAAARTRAITMAVADARDQAQSAARAAGITLGKIINIQLSAPSSYPYPVPLGVAAGGPASSGAPATMPSPTSGTAIACAAGTRCPYFAYSSYATVTITWAIR